ncbi:MAG TPA: hypothetical protein VLI04_13915 [Nocardioidaceae bacterium]|nr:hypothetical protein [Nocardioidaceae bacterium]
MVSFAPTHRETLEDQRRYLEGHLAEVACLDCLAKVRVRKNSEPHTSIQWSAEAASQCQEFSRHGVDRKVMESCPRLKASIESALRDGSLEIGATVD